MSAPISAWAVSTKWHTSPRIRPPCRRSVYQWPSGTGPAATRYTRNLGEAIPARAARAGRTAGDQRRLNPIMSCRSDASQALSTWSSSSMLRATGFSHHTCRPSLRASAVSSAWVSCGVAITTMPTSGSSMTGNVPETALSKWYRSAARRAVIPPAEVTATKRLKPARRNAGSSVPVENAPAPIQPIPAAGVLGAEGSLEGEPAGARLPVGGSTEGTLASGRRGAGTTVAIMGAAELAEDGMAGAGLGEDGMAGLGEDGMPGAGLGEDGVPGAATAVEGMRLGSAGT